jgi:putative transposase
VPHDVRDLVVDFVRRWSEKTEIGVGRFIPWLGVTASKFYDWRQRYGCVNEHNGWVPRDFWLELWEKEAIIEFHLKNPLEGYRRLTFMMLDADVVAVSPASVWRVLKQAGLLSRWKRRPSRKGTGFEQPISTGISTFPTSTYAARSITCAAFWMGSVASSCIGTCVSPCEKLMSK